MSRPRGRPALYVHFYKTKDDASRQHTSGPFLCVNFPPEQSAYICARRERGSQVIARLRGYAEDFYYRSYDVPGETYVDFDSMAIDTSPCFTPKG